MIKEMSPRERVLAIIVGSAAFLFLNFLVIDYFLQNQSRLKADLARGTATLSTMQLQLASKGMWEARDAWLTAKQPVLGAEDSAKVKLLDQVKEVAKQHSVQLIDNQLGTVGNTAEYTSITVNLQTLSNWASLIAFMHALQGPEQFIVFEKAALKVDEKDDTKMRGEFKIAKWYAPKGS